jgi:hypothetical protein
MTTTTTTIVVVGGPNPRLTDHDDPTQPLPAGTPWRPTLRHRIWHRLVLQLKANPLADWSDPLERWDDDDRLVPVHTVRRWMRRERYRTKTAIYLAAAVVGAVVGYVLVASLWVWLLTGAT